MSLPDVLGVPDVPDVPDVLGLDLSEAEILLAEAGVPWTVQETAPPRGAAEGVLKVVGRRPAEDGGAALVLVVCRVADGFRE